MTGYAFFESCSVITYPTKDFPYPVRNLARRSKQPGPGKIFANVRLAPEDMEEIVNFTADIAGLLAGAREGTHCDSERWRHVRGL